MNALRRNYGILQNMPEVVMLHSAAGAVVATWDDHDFGRNDAGASYKWAAASREIFLSFWRGEGAAAARGARGGRVRGERVRGGRTRGAGDPA